jgi:hypothetical protein
MFPNPNVVFEGLSFHTGSFATSGCVGIRLSELFIAVLVETMEFWLDEILDLGLERTGLGLAATPVLSPEPKPSVRFVGRLALSSAEILGFGSVAPTSKAIAACIGQ